MDVREFDKLQGRVRKAMSSLDRSRGALDQIREKVKRRYGCDSLEDARELLSATEREIQEEEAEFQPRVAAFQEKLKEAGF